MGDIGDLSGVRKGWTIIFRNPTDGHLVMQCRPMEGSLGTPHWELEFFDPLQELDVVPGLMLEHMMGPDHGFTRIQAERWMELMRFRTTGPIAWAPKLTEPILIPTSEWVKIR